jgi:hypothetical protein
LPPAHAFVLGDGPALVGNDLLEAFTQARDLIVVRGGVNDEHHFVLSLRFQNNSPSQIRPVMSYES